MAGRDRYGRPPTIPVNGNHTSLRPAYLLSCRAPGLYDKLLAATGAQPDEAGCATLRCPDQLRRVVDPMQASAAEIKSFRLATWIRATHFAPLDHLRDFCPVVTTPLLLVLASAPYAQLDAAGDAVR